MNENLKFMDSVEKLFIYFIYNLFYLSYYLFINIKIFSYCYILYLKLKLKKKLKMAYIQLYIQD
jgi:hypothetical protein